MFRNDTNGECVLVTPTEKAVKRKYRKKEKKKLATIRLTDPSDINVHQASIHININTNYNMT